MGSANNTSSLQDKFIKSGLKNMSDREILELLLSLGTPNKDYHGLARRIISRFKSLKDLLQAPAEEIKRMPGISNQDSLFIDVVRGLSQKYHQDRILQRPVYRAGGTVFDYLYDEMKGLNKEQFKMICLDEGTRITDTLDILTIKPDSSVAESSRLVIENAIRRNARYFIVAHNHLSGDPKPSQMDKDVTRDLVFAGAIIRIRLLDHIILGKDSFFSFSSEGLIEAYEMDYQDLWLRGTAEAKRRVKRARQEASRFRRPAPAPRQSPPPDSAETS